MQKIKEREGKDCDAGRDWGQEEKGMTKDEMPGWHHRLNGREFEWTRWTWVWVNSGKWWWTGRPGMLRFMGSQRVGHDWATELNWTDGVTKSWTRLSDFTFTTTLVQRDFFIVLALIFTLKSQQNTSPGGLTSTFLGTGSLVVGGRRRSRNLTKSFVVVKDYSIAKCLCCQTIIDNPFQPDYLKIGI